MTRQGNPSPNLSDGPAGSPDKGEPVFVAVGFLRRAHGVHGEMIMDILTGFPERLRPHRTVFVGEDREPIKLASVRRHDPALLVRLEGCTTPEEAARYRNQVVCVRIDQLPELPEGEYYHHQILGIQVYLESGEKLGSLKEILETGANDVYVIAREGAEDMLLPAIEDVVLSIDVEANRMVVKLQEWL